MEPSLGTNFFTAGQPPRKDELLSKNAFKTTDGGGKGFSIAIHCGMVKAYRGMG